jgi:DNA-binding response OmpR family regulator
VKKKQNKTPKKIKIFVVENDADVITRLYLGLMRLDFEVEITDSSEDLQGRLKSFRPQILLLSGHLMSAPLCREVKEKFGIPIIVSSNGNLPLQSLDVDETVPRPFNFPELGQKITALVEHYGEL